MTAMTQDELLDFRISSIINSAEDAMFQKFNELQKQGHSDEDIITYLRKQGYTDYAESYIEWSGAPDPDREPNSTLDPTVPDPGNAESYTQMGRVMAGLANFKAEANRIAPGTVK